MSLAHARQIAKLIKRVNALEKLTQELKTTSDWQTKQMETGLADIIERVVKETIEIGFVEPTVDDELKLLMNKEK